MKINLMSGKVLTILGGILILIAMSFPMKLAREFCAESGPGIVENECYFDLLDRYHTCQETQDRIVDPESGFTTGFYSCSITGWNSGTAAIFSGIAGGLLMIYGVLRKEKEGQRFSIPVIILSALLMIITLLYLFWISNVPGPSILLIGAMVSAAGGYSRGTSSDFVPPKLKNMWPRFRPAVLGPILILVILLIEDGEALLRWSGNIFFIYPIPSLLSILIATRIKHPFLSFVVSLLISAIGIVVAVIGYFFATFSFL